MVNYNTNQNVPPPQNRHTRSNPCADEQPRELISATLRYIKRGLAVLPVYSLNEQGHCRCKKGASCNAPGKHPISNSTGTWNVAKDEVKGPHRKRWGFSVVTRTNRVANLDCPGVA